MVFWRAHSVPATGVYAASPKLVQMLVRMLVVVLVLVLVLVVWCGVVSMFLLHLLIAGCDSLLVVIFNVVPVHVQTLTWTDMSSKHPC